MYHHPAEAVRSHAGNSCLFLPLRTLARNTTKDRLLGSITTRRLSDRFDLLLQVVQRRCLQLKLSLLIVDLALLLRHGSHEVFHRRLIERIFRRLLIERFFRRPLIDRLRPHGTRSQDHREHDRCREGKPPPSSLVHGTPLHSRYPVRPARFGRPDLDRPCATLPNRRRCQGQRYQSDARSTSGAQETVAST